jgi:hypothetical protein
MGKLIYGVVSQECMFDKPPCGAQEMASEFSLESDSLELVSSSKSSDRTKKVATAAIFAAASIAASPIAAFIPRIPGWDIALFDPVSFFWLAAFLVGGLWIGAISALAGMIGLFFFDPSVIGPVFKFEATFIMMIIPWLMTKRFGEGQGSYLRLPRVYTPAISLAGLTRISIMILTNLVVVPILYGPIFTAEFIIIYAVLINGFQSVLDAVVPYLVIHATPIFRRFGLW